MKFHKTPIADVLLIEPQVFGDDRGFFMETWQALKFHAAGVDANFVQDNHSRSTQWTLRGNAARAACCSCRMGADQPGSDGLDIPSGATPLSHRYCQSV